MSDINLLPNADHKHDVEKEREKKDQHQKIEWSTLKEKPQASSKQGGSFWREVKDEVKYIKDDVSNFLRINKKKEGGLDDVKKDKGVEKEKVHKIKLPVEKNDNKKILDKRDKNDILNLKDIKLPEKKDNVQENKMAVKQKNNNKDGQEKKNGLDNLDKKETKTEIKELGKIKKVNFQPDSKLDINLIPSDLKLSNAFKNNIKVYIIVIALVIIIGLGSSLFVQQLAHARRQAVKEIDVKKQETQRAITLLQNKNQEVRDFTILLKEVKSLIDKHVYISNTFGFLERHTLNEIYFTTLQVDTLASSAYITVYARDYEVMAEQLAYWQTLTEIVDDLDVSNVVLETQKSKKDGEDEDKEKTLVNFNLKIDFNRDFFLNKYEFRSN